MSRTGKAIRRGAVGLLGLAAILIGTGGAVAEDSDPQQAPRTVRLSMAQGHVQLTQGGQAVTDQALLNTPLFEGAQISTADDAQAELQFEDGSVVRVPPASSITLTVLKQDETEVTLNSGIGYFELQGANDNFKVRFDGSVATASGSTVMRIKLDEPPGSIAVFSGNAHLESNGAQADVAGGQSATLGTSSSGEFSVADNIEPDSWDAWNSDRGQAQKAYGNPAPPDNELPNQNDPAWSDLNANGAWYNVPDQGYVWSPYEASNPDWDPYGMGNWMYTPGPGYVWVSGYSWGYMPYQCGNWNWYNTFGWGWAPGPCQAFWTAGGGAGWYFNVRNPPRWYRLPVRPGPPHPRDPNPKRILHAIGPQPIIPVIREPQHGSPRTLPPRDRATPVLLGGKTVEPLRPVGRPVYRPQPGAGRPGYTVTGGGLAPAGGGRQDYVRQPGNGGSSAPVPVYRPAPIARPAPGGSNDGARPMPTPGGGNQLPRIITPAPPPPHVEPHPIPAPSPGSHAIPAAPRPVSSGGGGGGGRVSAPSGGGGGHSAPAPSSSSHK
jgi:hypothetical protein